MISIGFTLLYFKMVMIPLVPETKMANVGKLISLGNLLVRKVTWFVLTTTLASLILSRAFGAIHTMKIAYIYSRLPRTLILSIFTYRVNTLSLSHILTYRDSSLSLSLFISTSRNSLTLPVSKTQFNTGNMDAYTFCNFFLSCSAFTVRLLPASNQPQKFCQTPKETNNQHGRRHVPPRIHCYISVYWYLAWNN